MLNSGKSYIEQSRQTKISSFVNIRHFSARQDSSKLAEADAISSASPRH